MAVTRPPKPYPDFPLYPHASGQWCRREKGKTTYFGKWSTDPEGKEALLEYEAWQRKQAPPARQPIQDTMSLPVSDGCNLFLGAMNARVQKGSLASRSFRSYRDTCKRLVRLLGGDTPIASLTPARFTRLHDQLSETLAAMSLGNEVTRVKTVFHWLKANQHIKTAVSFGTEFRRPPVRQLRLDRSASPKKCFTPAQVHQLLDEGGLQMRAMMYLAVNCGFDNSGLNKLRLSELDLEGGWIRGLRTKTAVHRVCKLWPETVEALRQWLARREHYTAATADLALRVFIRPDGKEWNPDRGAENNISEHFRSIRQRAGLAEGTFYWLRHTFRTIGDRAKDRVAIDVMMGHADQTMADNYREYVEDYRIEAITTVVRDWLLGLDKSATMNDDDSTSPTKGG